METTTPTTILLRTLGDLSPLTGPNTPLNLDLWTIARTCGDDNELFVGRVSQRIEAEFYGDRDHCGNLSEQRPSATLAEEALRMLLISAWHEDGDEAVAKHLLFEVTQHDGWVAADSSRFGADAG